MFGSYDFIAPGQVMFGWGRRDQIGALCARYADKAFLICGSRHLKDNQTVEGIQTAIQEAGVVCRELVTIHHEPEVGDVDVYAEQLRQHAQSGTHVVVAIGGGSAIDLGKAVAAMATNSNGASVIEFLEGVGQGRIIQKPPCPLIAMPTTAGTGSEATKNAVITSHVLEFKKSLRSPLMVPNATVIDPELTQSLPAAVSAQTGMDAITQLIESYISKRAKPIPKVLALAGLEKAIPAITEVVRDKPSRSAREHMAHAALLSGMALANSGLGMAHGVAAALGVHARVPHGLACAVMLPTAMRINCQVRISEMACLGRLFARVTQQTICSQDDESAADFACRYVEDLCQQLGIPDKLSEIGVSQDQLPAIVKSSWGNSMRGNPRELSQTELTQILERMR